MARQHRVADLRRLLLRVGCAPLRTHGSHESWRTPRGRRFGLVVNHRGADVSRIVLANVRRVLKDEGLDVDAEVET